ncbi:unannotated protein [freshwater metagenome]|uniref:Unannotated protein n=1 Tax=freshwater metagenome TaxID=449393 RepID=A0A6J6NI57_9ZZZZ
MAFSGEVHNSVVSVHRRSHRSAIANVTLDESESRIICDVIETRQIPGVGKCIEHRDFIVGGRKYMTDIVRSDESSGASDEQLHEKRKPSMRLQAIKDED